MSVLLSGCVGASSWLINPRKVSTDDLTHYNRVFALLSRLSIWQISSRTIRASEASHLESTIRFQRGCFTFYETLWVVLQRHLILYDIAVSVSHPEILEACILYWRIVGVGLALILSRIYI
jgi:hypothetical protein